MMFNKYGNCILPDAIEAAKDNYFAVIKTYLDTLPVLECRALLMYINMDVHLSEYILDRQVKIEREERIQARQAKISREVMTRTAWDNVV